MSTNTTRRMIAAYYSQREPSAFFSGMFEARPENFHDSEEVEIDIVRSGEDVAIAVQDMSTGYRMNSMDLFTNKSFKPPVFKEAVPLKSSDLMKRVPGANPFESPVFRGNVITRAMTGIRMVERKIRRAVELQSSQIMQTGTVTLTDAAGAAVYTIDYKPKATHFATVGTSWASATLAQKLADIETACELVSSDGLETADELIIGDDAFENLIQTSGFSDVRFDSQRANTGQITPMERRGNGGIYRGTIEVGNYKLDVFTYAGRYKHPQTGVSTRYMDPGKFVVRASGARLDATFGAVPNIGELLGVTRRIVPELPSRMSSREGAMDIHTNVWLTDNGEQMFAGVASRPLMIPTAIDAYCCFDTQL